ncbi:hypothetical protein D3C79_1045630 [compost metagenome]
MIGTFNGRGDFNHDLLSKAHGEIANGQAGIFDSDDFWLSVCRQIEPYEDSIFMTLFDRRELLKDH